jgi:DNA-binding NtrC family response regulator
MNYGTKRALVVDEEAWWRHLVKGLLTDQGFEVNLSSHLDPGLTEAGRREYDMLLISDLVLDDPVLLARLRCIMERRPGQPVILVSSVADWQRTRHAFRLGATDHITKSLELEEVRLSLARHLQAISP